MMRCAKLSILALGLSSAAMAATPPSTSSAVAKASPVVAPTVPGGRRAISAEGNVIAKRVMETPDPRIAEIRAEIGQLQQQKLDIAKSANPDIDRLEQIIRREEALKAEALKHVDDRFVALLRALSAADRAVVLQNLANPVKLPNGAGPSAGQPAPARPAKGN